MPSRFVIQVVDQKSGTVVEWAPGMAVERQLVEDLCARVAAKKVGFLAREAHVIAAVQESLLALLHDLKSDVHPSR